jgi:hypothetical protein
VRREAAAEARLERIKGLCGAKPPQKPGWTGAVGLGVSRVVRNRGTSGRVSGVAGQPGTYIRCNFHSARLIPELIAGADGPSGNRPWFFMVLRISSSYVLCNKHRRFRRLYPIKRPQTVDLINQFRKLAATCRTHSIAGQAVNFERVPGTIGHRRRERQPER